MITSAKGKIPYGAAIGALRDSTAVGRCVCTARAIHTSHVHPRGWISSACYIQLPDSMTAGHTAEGILSFGAPGMITTPVLDAELSVRPELGQLVLFPSYFWHGTLPFDSDQPRLTVAFDVVPERATRSS